MDQVIYNLGMAVNKRGRPPEFDRDRAVCEAARLFWRHGYSGTSTRDLTSAIGISTSSLYSAFGSKAGLFEDSVRIYARRYVVIYEKALAAQSIRVAIDELLRESIVEFTQPADSHPGCLIASAVMSDSPATQNARGDISNMLTKNERLLRARIGTAIDEGEILGGTDADVVTGVVQTLWQGLSAQSHRGVRRNELLRVADFSQRAMWSTYSR
ncbi:transcriptional regulator, TetR family [Brevibacterium antiquum CNRZ 918]|uniref:Transcriptional regulator, TetR family n=2 Tax=Brevibacteriaceae TaxID=85019 RepID=A0A2H1J2E4_9MICO|nr:transcriptional regulator, TetR family [Brevibacterium antiquum CNRZ 918]